MTDDRRFANWEKATRGARQALERIEHPRRPRHGQLTQQAINALYRVRNEVSLGSDRKDIIDLIDDELHRLKR